jgi:hypothetical protein
MDGIICKVFNTSLCVLINYGYVEYIYIYIYLGMLSGLLPMLFLGQISRFKMNLTHTKCFFCEKNMSLIHHMSKTKIKINSSISYNKFQ